MGHYSLTHSRTDGLTGQRSLSLPPSSKARSLFILYKSCWLHALIPVHTHALHTLTHTRWLLGHWRPAWMEAVGKVVACFRFGWVHWAGLVAVEAASLRDRRASELRSTAISSAPPRSAIPLSRRSPARSNCPSICPRRKEGACTGVVAVALRIGGIRRRVTRLT